MSKHLFGMSLFLLFCAVSLGVALADPPGPEKKNQAKPTETRRVEEPKGKGGRQTPEVEQAKDKGGNRHGIFGTLPVNPGSSSFTVATKQGVVTVLVTADTRVRFPGKKNASLSDLHAGDRVAVNGQPTAEGLAAKHVNILPSKPSFEHRVGTVTAYLPGARLEIKEVRGNQETFSVSADTEVRNAKGSRVEIGDRVTVVAERESGAETAAARAIVVYPR
jgi:hypothetical protein